VANLQEGHLGPAPGAKPRRNDLDWLRVLAIGAVFIFHCARPFNGGWHVSAPETTEGFVLMAGFMVPWLMPLIFAISGAALTLDARVTAPGRFALEKVKRLLIPLAFGVFFMGPVMVYLERLSHGQFQGSLFDFLPHYFVGWYGLEPGGNFAWMGLHCWYLLVLFAYTLLCWPLFRWFKSAYGGRFLARLGRGLAKPGVVYALVVPAWFLFMTANLVGWPGMREFGGIPLDVYFLVFIYGFLLFSSSELQDAVLRQRWVSLGLAAAAGAGVTALVALNQRTGMFWDLAQALFGWTFILAAFGFARKGLTTRNRFLEWANEAVLPFYILHQTVIVVVAWFVLGWPLPALAQYAIILALSLPVILGLYQFLVRRFNVLRFIFGMRLRRPARTH
jgi:peptidoglycan/LPS O-acetylase OafA/YrhL